MELLKRLEEVEPMYKVSEWIDDWQRKEELADMITSFPNGVAAPELSVTPATSPRHRASNADSTSCKTSTSPKRKNSVAKNTCASKGGTSKKSKAVDRPAVSVGNNPSDEKTEEKESSKQQDEEQEASTRAIQSEKTPEVEKDQPLTPQTSTPADNNIETRPSTSSAESSKSSQQTSSAESSKSSQQTSSASSTSVHSTTPDKE